MCVAASIHIINVCYNNKCFLAGYTLFHHSFLYKKLFTIYWMEFGVLPYDLASLQSADFQ